MKTKEQQLMESLHHINAQIEDYESRLHALRADREGMMGQLVEIRVNRAPILVV
jgi:SMC interacting uncharacterized protein involved in chromosome segregation